METPDPGRLEAFSDGVIAVIITIMVLEIKVPQADGFQGLLALAPGIAIYLLSFAFTGIYWLNHQHLVRRVEKAGHAMQCANLGFLFCLSLLPLSTAYVVEKRLSGFAVAVYAASLLIVGLSFMGLRLSVYADLNRRDALLEEDRRGFRNHVAGLLLYAGGTAAGVFYPKVVLGGIALLTLLWIFPNLSLRPVKRKDE